MSIEVWEDLSLDTDYAISNYGKLLNKKTNYSFKFCTDNNGYKILKLGKGAGRTSMRLHQLVAKQFVRGEREELVVNHKDGNKENNRYDNLEWVTQARNIEHAIARYWVVVHPTGQEELVYNMKKFCKKNNLHHSHLYDVARGLRKQHKGFTALKVEQ